MDYAPELVPSLLILFLVSKFYGLQILGWVFIFSEEMVSIWPTSCLWDGPCNLIDNSSGKRIQCFDWNEHTFHFCNSTLFVSYCFVTWQNQVSFYKKLFNLLIDNCAPQFISLQKLAAV
jgi:hypothetical protein